MREIGRWLVIAGAGAVAAAAPMPWITVQGLPLDLDWLGADITETDRTVGGLDTVVWPGLAAIAGIAGVLALLGRARVVLAAVGTLTLLAGSGLLYYLNNVVDIEAEKQGPLGETLADLAITSTVEPGPYVLLAGGAAILVGALLLRPRSSSAALTGFG